MAVAFRHSSRGLVWVAFIGAGVITADQFVKWLAINNLQGQPPVEVLGDWFKLTFVRNSGAAFSIGSEYTWVFSIAATVVAIAILFYSRKVTALPWLVAMGLLFGGAVGNLIDRIAQPPGGGFGEVVDMLQLPNWPVFNVADMAVMTGAIMLVALSLFGIEPGLDADGGEDGAVPAPEAGVAGDSEASGVSGVSETSESARASGETARASGVAARSGDRTGTGPVRSADG